MVSTCKDCKKRKLYCHATCEEYKAARTAHEQEQRRINTERNKHSEHNAYLKYSHERAMRRSR